MVVLPRGQVENVVNETNASRFLQKRALFKRKYAGTGMADPLTVFHGTGSENIHGIGTSIASVVN